MAASENRMQFLPRITPCNYNLTKMTKTKTETKNVYGLKKL